LYINIYFECDMSSPLQREVLTPKKPIWVYRLEQKIVQQEQRIKHFEDALEEMSKRLQIALESASMPIKNTSPCLLPTNSPQFGLSL